MIRIAHSTSYVTYSWYELTHALTNFNNILHIHGMNLHVDDNIMIFRDFRPPKKITRINHEF